LGGEEEEALDSLMHVGKVEVLLEVQEANMNGMWTRMPLNYKMGLKWAGEKGLTTSG